MPTSSGGVSFPKLEPPKQELGFLGRFIDIISRPLRTISNPVMKAVELPERFDKVNELRLTGDDSAANKEALSAVGSLLAAPFTGFFSDNPDHKPYWSDIIERHSDVSNRNDPNYVDVANNVNPATKGGLGFALDFILDPLWLVPYVGWGGKLFGTAARATRALKKEGITDAPFPVADVSGTKIIQDVAQANAAAAASQQSETVFQLSTRRARQESDPIREFATKEEALAAVAAEQRKAGPRARPWVDTADLPSGQRPGGNTNTFTITPVTRPVQAVPVGSKAANLPDNVPASSITDRLTRELLEPKNIKKGESSAEFIARTVGNILNDAAKTPGGQNPLAEFLTNLAKTAAPAAKVAAKPDSFDKWLTRLAKDKNAVESSIQIPESITLRGAGLGVQSSMKYILDMYKMTRNTEVKDAIRSMILEPAYSRYAAGVKAGKTVNALGNAATSAAVAREVAQTRNATQLVHALTKLDDANAARLGELMGEDFLALLRQSDPQTINQFLDDFKMILLKTGSLEALGRATPDSLLGAALGRFDVDPNALARNIADVNRRIEDIPVSPPQSLAKAAENIADNAEFQGSLRAILESLGYPAESLNRAVEAGRSLKGLYETMLGVAAGAVKGPINRKLNKKYQDKNYPHEYAGVRKSDPDYLEGVGVIPREPATYFQFDLFLSVAKTVGGVVTGPKRFRDFSTPKGGIFPAKKRAAEKERLTIATLKVLEDFLTKEGLPLTFDYQGVFHNMRFTQAYEQVRSVVGENAMMFSFFNANTGLAPTQFIEAVAKAMSGGTPVEVRQILTSGVDRNGRSIVNAEGKAINFLNGPRKTGNLGKGFVIANNQLADLLTRGIMDSVPALKSISQTNAENFVARGKVETRVVTENVADYLVGLINSPEKLAEAIRAVANADRVVGDFARSIKATELGAGAAAAATKAGLGDVLRKNAEEIVALEKAVVSGDPKKIQEANRKMFESAEEFQARLRAQAEDIAEEAMASGRQLDNVPPGPLEDAAQGAKMIVEDQIATGAYGTMQAMIAKILDPLNKFFNIKAGMHTDLFPWAYRLFAATGNNMHALASAFFNPLRAITANKAFMAKISPDSKVRVIDQAVLNVQRNIRSAEGTVLREAEDAVRPLIGRFFDTSDDLFNVILGNVFFRTGAGIDAVNDALAVNKVLGNNTPPTGVYFDRDLAEQTVRARIAAEVTQQGRPMRNATDDEILREMYGQWRTWDIDDPIEFLSSLHRAVVQTAVENSFAVGFRQKAFATGVASAKPQAGFVKFTFAEDSRYAKYFGDEPMYMLPEAAETLEAIDKFTRTSKTFEGAFGKFTREVLDPFTDVWKYAVTLPRPGHHTRNMIGDITLTYLAEGGYKSLSATRTAIKMMFTKGDFTDVDVTRLLLGAGLETPKKGALAVGNIKLKNGTFDFTLTELYEEVIRLGMLPPAKGREGLRKGRGFDENEMGDPAFARILEKGIGYVNPLARRGGRTEEFIMDVAEGRDHFVRLQHLIQILEKAKAGKRLTVTFGKTVDPRTMTREELLIYAADRVSKYHPDLSTLAVGERKYLKRLMPFYHWNRGAFQAVMETAVMNPARVLAFPKASYNIAEAAGINPYSLYDPFPTDQMFPSFLSSEMQGPQFEVGGRYYGIRPGIVTFDVLNQLRTGNPVDAIMSNMNPAFKIPLELMTGVRLDTGARIRDYSDYIDASIPGVNYAANVSGYSVTGSLVSLLTGGGFDRQLQYELGNRGTSEQLTSALNWLTGIGLVDYSRPTFIRYAENEFRRENAPDTGRSPF